MQRRLLSRPLALAAALAAATLSSCGGGDGGPPPSVLVFSRTTGFRHPSIEPAVAALRRLGEENGFVVEHTEDPSAFDAENLSRHHVVLFLHTTGNPLAEPSERTALEDFIRSGGGFVGIHAASDQDETSRSTWPWYGRLVGAYFGGHPLYSSRPEGDESCGFGPIVSCHDGTATVEDVAHPSTEHLAEQSSTSPPTWEVYDEFYGFDTNPRGSARVLLTLDESTYLDDPRRIPFGPGFMGEDHPIAWCHPFEGGRSFYTSLGHDTLLFENDAYLRHLLGGILWAAGAVAGDCSTSGG
jgi:type 1 glutamine amidotransferase